MHHPVRILNLLRTVQWMAAGSVSITVATPCLSQNTPTISEFTKSMHIEEGLLPLYLDRAKDAVYLRVDRLGQEMLYHTSLASGIGSLEFMLDRGTSNLTGAKVVRLQRAGTKVLLIEKNYGFRTEEKEPSAQKAIADSFPESVLWSFSISAEQDGKVLVDATSFLLRDSFNVAQALKEKKKVDYTVVNDRCAVQFSGCRSFPRNTEIEAIVTLTGTPAPALEAVAPTPTYITLREHQSFTALPDHTYTRRSEIPGDGQFSVRYEDYTDPLPEVLTKRFVKRSRLEKRNADALISEPVKPITFYIDHTAPAKVRQAIKDGTLWWNRAFEAAGFKNAIRVDLLPEDVDPLDARYNVILWSSRDGRGYSYAEWLADPRSGELLNGHIVLDSRSGSWDHKFGRALLNPYEGPEGEVVMEKLVLSRIRHLVAHEVGHSLGLMHNFAGGAQGNASVMDYMPPNVEFHADGTPDLSKAYSEGIGEWDVTAIRLAYGVYPAETEMKDRARLLSESRLRGIYFLGRNDVDAGIHPGVGIYDDRNPDRVSALLDRLKLRKFVIQRLGERAVLPGKPMASLEEALAAIFLYPSDQLPATAAMLGGARYTYSVRGDGTKPLEPIPAPEQRRALQALVTFMKPEQFELPARFIALIPPRPHEYPVPTGVFNRLTGGMFDIFGPTAPIAYNSLAEILSFERCARLVQQHSINPVMPGLFETLDRFASALTPAISGESVNAQVARLVRRIFVERLIAIAIGAPMPAVRASAMAKLHEIEKLLAIRLPRHQSDRAEQADCLLLRQDLKQFFDRPFQLPAGMELPQRLALPQLMCGM